MTRTLALSLCLIVAGCAPEPTSQTTGAAELTAEIGRLKAIDNHAHPLKFVGEGEKPDEDFDALAVDPSTGLEAFAMPVRLRPENPDFVEAWRTLFKYPHSDFAPAHLSEGQKLKQAVTAQHGDTYPSWVLDQLGIETMFANRVVMGRGLASPRFRWVPFADALMVPLNNEGARRTNNDYRVFYPAEDRLLKRYLADLQMAKLPGTLDQYAKTVVTATLERQKGQGAVATKFEAAYLRSLDFDDASQADAARIYAKYVGGAEPPADEYKTLQDFLFRYIAREAGRVGLAVHIHVADGVGANYRPSGSNPMLLEPAFNDPSLRKTTFVIVHGLHYTREVRALLAKANVYADFSAQTFTLHPPALADVLRSWLEYFPEKVMFGTDAFAIAPEIGWEELGWLSTTTARQGLGIALTGMVDDGEITLDRAKELAGMVLRENAIKLYGLR